MAAYVQSGSQSQAEGVGARIEALNGALEDPEGPLAITTYRATGVSEGEIAFGEFLETNAVVRAA
jgi:hypothetical protein